MGPTDLCVAADTPPRSVTSPYHACQEKETVKKWAPTAPASRSWTAGFTRKSGKLTFFQPRPRSSVCVSLLDLGEQRSSRSRCSNRSIRLNGSRSLHRRHEHVRRTRIRFFSTNTHTPHEHGLCLSKGEADRTSDAIEQFERAFRFDLLRQDGFPQKLPHVLSRGIFQRR